MLIKPKISFITPSFNHDKYISKTIDSILSQNYSNFEHWIIDGGSTDNTLNILKNYPHLKIISEKDDGQANAINKGFHKASGDLIWWINSDDFLQPNAIKNLLYSYNKNPNAEWFIGKCKIVDENEIEIRKWITNYKNLLLNFQSKKLIQCENFISQPSCIFTKEIIKKAGYLKENDHLTFDYEYWLRLYKISKPVFINNYLSCFRWYNSSKSGTNFNTQFNNEIKWLKFHGYKCKMTYWIHLFNKYKIIGIYTLMHYLKLLKKHD